MHLAPRKHKKNKFSKIQCVSFQWKDKFLIKVCCSKSLSGPEFAQRTLIYFCAVFQELLITAGGENVAPVPIEDAVKRNLPEGVSNVMVLGDRRKFLSCLITLKVKVDQVSEH